MHVLLTAFEPYDEWSTNSSWLTLVEVLAARPAQSTLTTRRYPVDWSRLPSVLEKDLQLGFDAVVHLGQAPGATCIRIEALAVNAGDSVHAPQGRNDRLISNAPEAYRTQMPIERWVNLLRAQNIPAQISYHAGTYLCNALMFLTHHWYASRRQAVPVAFVHLPLSHQQVAEKGSAIPSMDLEAMAQAIGLLLDDIQQGETPPI